MFRASFSLITFIQKELNLFFFGLDQSCVNVKIVIERFIKDLPSLFIARSRVVSLNFCFYSVNKSTFHQSTGIKSRLVGTRYLSVFQLHSLISSPAKPSLESRREKKSAYSVRVGWFCRHS